MTKRKPSGWRVGCQALAPSPSDACVTALKPSTQGMRGTLRNRRTQAGSIRKPPPPTTGRPFNAPSCAYRSPEISTNFAGVRTLLCISRWIGCAFLRTAPSGEPRAAFQAHRNPQVGDAIFLRRRKPAGADIHLDRGQQQLRRRQRRVARLAHRDELVLGDAGGQMNVAPLLARPSSPSDIRRGPAPCSRGT